MITIKKPIAKLHKSETRLGLEVKSTAKKRKTIAEKKADVLFDTKMINRLKLMRNGMGMNTKQKKAMQDMIDVAEKLLAEKRKKYKL